MWCSSGSGLSSPPLREQLLNTFILLTTRAPHPLTDELIVAGHHVFEALVRQVDDQDLLSGIQKLALAGTLMGSVLFYGLARYAKGLHALRWTEEADSRYRRLKPTQGKTLREREASLWRESVDSTSEPAEILWFPNVAILARALSSHGWGKMAVSTGLYESWKMPHSRSCPVIGSKRTLYRLHADVRWQICVRQRRYAGYRFSQSANRSGPLLRLRPKH